LTILLQIELLDQFGNLTVGVIQITLVFAEQQQYHKFDDFSRRKMLTGCFVILLAESPDQVLEDQAHISIVDTIVQINIPKFLHHQKQQTATLTLCNLNIFGLACTLQTPNLATEVEFLDNILHIWAKPIQIVHKILIDIVWGF